MALVSRRERAGVYQLVYRRCTSWYTPRRADRPQRHIPDPVERWKS